MAASASEASGLAVLVADDEKNIRVGLRVCLEAMGCQVVEAASGPGALEAVQRQPFDIALVDLRLGESSGLDLLPRLLAHRPDLDVVLITAYATVETAVEAIRRGARDYVPKPFTPAQIRLVVERLAERRALVSRLALLARPGESASELELSTASPRMRAVLEVVGRAAAHDVPVLLTGENGTGKSVLARHLHARSPRRDHPFVVVNCPTLTAELLASELFGHARGAFTGAVRDQAGRVEAAEHGTLFLDEIGELPPPVQAKLLRFLQDKQFERVGENQTRSADVRIVAATNRDLEAEVRAGRFREDLLFRLNTLEVTVPPLRERPEDILPLAHRFVAHFAAAMGRRALALSPEAEAALAGYAWPGNVRELRNAIERAAILCPAERIGAEYLPERIVARTSNAPFVGGDFSVDSIEREHILRVLARVGSVDEAARILGIDASTIWRKRRKYEGA